MPGSRPSRLALLLAASLAAGTAHAGSDPFDAARFSILPGWRTADGTHIAALQISLSPGWKTYWRAPGDAGIPPSFDLRASGNLAAVELHWPVPNVYHQNGMRTIGYSGDVVLPLELTPEGPGPIELRGEVELGVCQDVCIPMHFRLEALLPPSAQRDPRIGAALADRPASAREAGVERVLCEVEPIADGLRLRAEIRMPALGAEEVAVFEAPSPAIWVSDGAVRRDGGSLWAEAEMVPPSSKPFALDRSQVRITVLGGGQAVDILGCVAR